MPDFVINFYSTSQQPANYSGSIKLLVTSPQFEVECDNMPGEWQFEVCSYFELICINTEIRCIVNVRWKARLH